MFYYDLILRANIRSLREQFTPCFKAADCYPVDLRNSTAPNEYIKCQDYYCICSSNCFKLNGSSCEYSVCGQYNTTTSNCTATADAKDQTTAFLLSLFLSSFGAANFYIGRDDLGKKVMYCINSTILHLERSGQL